MQHQQKKRLPIWFRFVSVVHLFVWELGENRSFTYHFLLQQNKATSYYTYINSKNLPHADQSKRKSGKQSTT
ncbi:hypothetical protein L1987_46140 [Smallanthus sonchifolius]|uniref:Uncharacterized protein n=1 Tax=Smallanthus sonchifolius TaxID=185202 RepID=A0ACB9FYX9_9ASTR|nr:hypothetical protein L1987_46140 [Smallanthus sonchifolius]